MSDFNLDAARAGAQIQLRNGEDCVFVAFVPELSPGHRLIVRIGSSIYLRYENGQVDSGEKSSRDIIMAKPAPRTKEVTVYLYEEFDAGHVYVVPKIYDFGNSIASARVTLVEGQFVEGEK